MEVIIMNGNQITAKTSSSLKWSTITEIMAKLITPIVSIILTKLIAEEFFGIVSSILMLITLMEVFSAYGFCNAVIQKKFKDEAAMKKAQNVAFTVNACLSIILFIILLIASEPLTVLMVNDVKYQLAFIVLATQIVIFGFKSVPEAVLKRLFQFKRLFIIRIITALSSLLIAVPLAFVLPNELKFWAIVISAVAPELLKMMLLFTISKLKIRFEFSKLVFKELLGFSMFNLLGGIIVWAISWVDFFFVSFSFDAASAGEYRQPIIQLVQIFSLVEAAVLPVALSALARLKNNKEELARVFYRFQQITA
ncbi:MAG: oligosaccharide flippase family protein, partial [Erysipelotrichaceae bacterium]|nr:oligosaccharide flippase family protein [Erysipelotrichaceae bacterium]